MTVRRAVMTREDEISTPPRNNNNYDNNKKKTVTCFIKKNYSVTSKASRIGGVDKTPISFHVQ